jgi:hypothetical protein
MRARLLLVAALAGSMVAVGSPAGATCHPEKPSTCEPCRITGVEIGPNGLPRVTTDCP